MKARLFTASAILAALVVIAVVSAAATAAPTPPAAPGSPGSESYFDLARKDCVGTARNTTSKVWFTVADGVLSDTYWPTIDATNVNTLQYLVTDGRTFTDLQTRDMTYKVLADPTGMSCTVVATPDQANASHRYRIVTTYIADPARDAVLMRTSFVGPRRPFVRTPRSARGRDRRRRLRERRREQRHADQRPRPDGAGGLQHQHGDQRGQPRLRGPDLHGARILERVLERERRLRRLGQRRADDARQRPCAHPVRLRA